MASKSNVADGLSRDEDSEMVKLNVAVVKAKLPVWSDTLWEASTSPEREVSGILRR